MATFNTAESFKLNNVAAGTFPFTLRGGSYWIEFAGSANGLLTMGTKPTDGQVVVIGSITYRFKDTIAQINDVFIGSTNTDSIDNLIAAINGAAGVGTAYYTGTVANADASAGARSGNTTLISARAVGVTGITSTTTVTNATWTAATLTSGPATFDVERLGPDGVTWTARITQITGLTGQQTITLAPGQYQIVSTYGVNTVEVTRLPMAVE